MLKDKKPKLLPSASITSLFAVSFMLLMMVGSRISAEEEVTSRTYLPALLNRATGCNIIINPGQSIQAAIERSNGHQVICVRGGVYNEVINIWDSKPGMSLIAFPGERPILDGEGRLPDIYSTNEWRPLMLIASSDSVVSGFEIRNSAGRGVTIGGALSGAVKNVTVRDMIIHSNRDSGLIVHGEMQHPAHNILLENNLVYDNLQKNSVIFAWGSAVAILHATDSVVRGNHIYHNLGEGLVLDRYTSGLTAEDNIIYDNTAANLYLNRTQRPLVQRNLVFCTDDPRFTGEGFTLRDEIYETFDPVPPPSTDQVIINNIVIGCHTNFTVSSQTASGDRQGGLRNALIANNTFVHSRRGNSTDNTLNVKFEGTALYSNSKFINNLILQPDQRSQVGVVLGAADFSTFIVANNLYAVTPESSWFPGESGRIVGDPRLVNPILPAMNQPANAANYMLTAASPAINKGQTVSRIIDDYFKNTRPGTPDIGAHEHRN